MVATPAWVTTPIDESDDATATGSVVANGDNDPEGDGNSDPASADNIATLMSSLTLDQCKEAGL